MAYTAAAWMTVKTANDYRTMLDSSEQYVEMVSRNSGREEADAELVYLAGLIQEIRLACDADYRSK